MTIEIYCDGACKGNPGPAAWGSVFIQDGKIFKLGHGYLGSDSTNNRAELSAAIYSLDTLDPGSTVNLYSDSQYVIKGMTIWRHNWRRNNFAGVKNRDLWEQLITVASLHTVTWFWVKGHNGNEFNELADSLANKALINGGKL